MVTALVLCGLAWSQDLSVDTDDDAFVYMPPGPHVSLPGAAETPCILGYVGDTALIYANAAYPVVPAIDGQYRALLDGEEIELPMCEVSKEWAYER
jgi:hypothetical protein